MSYCSLSHTFALFQAVGFYVPHDVNPPVQVYEVGVLVLLIPYVFVKTLRYLAPFALLANLLTAVGLAITLVHCFENLQDTNKYPAFNSWTTIPLYFGTAIYAYEGISLVSSSLNWLRGNIFKKKMVYMV